MTILLFLAVVCVIQLYPLYKRLPAPSLPPPKNLAEANRQDIEYLRKLPEVDRSFTPETRKQFYKEISSLIDQAGSLDPAELEMEVSRVVAIADNAHTNAGGITRGRHLTILPLRFAWFKEGLFIIKATPPFRELLGAQVIKLGDKRPEELVKKLRPYVGGPENYAREFTPYLLASPQALYAANLLPSSSSAELTLQLSSGDTITRTIMTTSQQAVEPDENRWPKRDLNPLDKPNNNYSLLHVLDDKRELPLNIRLTTKKYWQTYLDSNTLYIQINSVTDDTKSVSFKDFLEQSIHDITNKKIRYVILDLRFNSGGNYERIVNFTEQLPQAIPSNGKIFVLTSANTFSAAIVTVARLKYFAKDQLVIVGEPMGDRGQYWAEGNRFILPNSNIPIRYSTGYHDWEHGCTLTMFSTCFFLNYLFGVSAGNLSPNIYISPTFKDYLEGEDTLLNEVKKHLVQ